MQFVTKTALCVLALMLMAGWSSAIECYTCGTDDSSPCNDDGSHTTETITDFQNVTCQYCFKHTNTTDSGVTYTTRGCFVTMGAGYTRDACHEATVEGPFGAVVVRCVCETDLCNQGNHLTALVTLPLMLVVARYIC